MHKKAVWLLTSVLVLGSLASCRNTSGTDKSSESFASGFDLSGGVGILSTSEQTGSQETQAANDGYRTRITYHNGNLKIVEEYDEFGNLTSEQNLGNSGYTCKYEYDAYGNLTKEIKIGTDGASQGGYEYEYDSAGNQTRKIYIDSAGNPGIVHEYTYDPNGNLLKDTEVGQDGTVGQWIVYAYDASGNPVIQTQMEPNGDSYVVNNEYEYDASGNITKVTNTRGGEANGWTEYEYDAAGNVTSEKVYKPDGNLKSWCEYTFDSEGNVLTRTTHKEDGSIFQKIVYEYSSGLLSVETKYDEEGEIMEMNQYVYE